MTRYFSIALVSAIFFLSPPRASLYGDTIYALNPGPSELMMFPSQEGLPITITEQFTFGVEGGVLSLDSTILYLLDLDGNLYFMPPDGSAAPTLFTTIALTGSNTARALAISSDGSTLYAIVIADTMTNPGAEVVSVEIASPFNQQIIVPPVSDEVYESLVIIDSTGYMIHGGKTTPNIFSFPTSGGSPTPFLTVTGAAGMVATHSGSDLIIVSDTAVYRVPIASPSANQISTQGGETITISVDDTNAYIIDNQSFTGTVYAIPVDGSNPSGTIIVRIPQANKVLLAGPSLSPPPPPPSGCLPYPPFNLEGFSNRVVSIIGSSSYNQLNWELPAQGAVPTAYHIYRNGVLQATLEGDVFTWQDLHPPVGGVLYSITSLSDTVESTGTSITVVTK